METYQKNSGKNAFTIVELLTVISVIILLISLVLPASNSLRKYARNVKQKAQFHAINIGIEIFNAEYEGYPPSDDPGQATGEPYCGAVKLCEALVGQGPELSGFYPLSTFDMNSIDNYSEADKSGNRKGPYLQLENANAHRLAHVWNIAEVRDVLPSVAGHDGDLFVLCDVFKKFINGDPNGKGKIGMPILYYKANTASNFIDPYDPNKKHIYNYEDNAALIDWGNPLMETHPMGLHPEVFYGVKLEGYPSLKHQYYYSGIKNTTFGDSLRPHRADSFILMSAGHDNLYGTKDDIFNF